MAITRLKRKELKLKIRAKLRKQIVKRGRRNTLKKVSK